MFPKIGKEKLYYQIIGSISNWMMIWTLNKYSKLETLLNAD